MSKHILLIVFFQILSVMWDFVRNMLRHRHNFTESWDFIDMDDIQGSEIGPHVPLCIPTAAERAHKVKIDILLVSFRFFPAKDDVMQKMWL